MPAIARCSRWHQKLLFIPGAVHCDLYDDRAGIAPYEMLERFFYENHKKTKKKGTTTQQSYLPGSSRIVESQAGTLSSKLC